MSPPPQPGCVVAGKLFNEPMRVETAVEVPETIARFLTEAAPLGSLVLNPHPSLPFAFDPGPTPSRLRRFEEQPDWRHPALANRYPRLSTDRKVADENTLEWVTPGHPLFEALRRNALDEAQPVFADGACFYSLRHDRPARVDFYRARVVDGMGKVIHERLFAIEIPEGVTPAFANQRLLVTSNLDSRRNHCLQSQALPKL